MYRMMYVHCTSGLPRMKENGFFHSFTSAFWHDPYSGKHNIPTGFFSYREQQHTNIIIIHVLIRDKNEERKQARSNKQTRQSNTTHPRYNVVSFRTRNELPQVGLKPTTLHSRQSALPLSYQGSSAGWGQISQRSTINSCIYMYSVYSM